MNTRPRSVSGDPSWARNLAESIRRRLSDGTAIATAWSTNRDRRRMEGCAASISSNTNRFTFGSPNVPRNESRAWDEAGP